jgi:hypothetical protein
LIDGRVDAPFAHEGYSVPVAAGIDFGAIQKGFSDALFPTDAGLTRSPAARIGTRSLRAGPVEIVFPFHAHYQPAR